MDVSIFETVKSLTKNAMRDICDGSKQAEVKVQSFIVQAIEVKIFTEEDNKKNIR
jgi:hypothetical protein